MVASLEDLAHSQLKYTEETLVEHHDLGSPCGVPRELDSSLNGLGTRVPEEEPIVALWEGREEFLAELEHPVMVSYVHLHPH